MDKSDDYQKIMRALRAPYKTSSAYEKYGEPQYDNKGDFGHEAMGFGSIGYVDKYEFIPFPGSKERPKHPS